MIPLCWYHHARCYEARVHGSCPSSLRTFFCRQRKLRRVKGKTFFVAETQCEVIIYGNGGQSFPWQEQTFNSHGRARSTRRTPRCVTIATYNERNYLPHSLRASSPIVKSRRARGTREETRKWLVPRGLAARSRLFARIARRACPQATYSMKLCVVMWQEVGIALCLFNRLYYFIWDFSHS